MFIIQCRSGTLSKVLAFFLIDSTVFSNSEQTPFIDKWMLPLDLLTSVLLCDISCKKKLLFLHFYMLLSEAQAAHGANGFAHFKQNKPSQLYLLEGTTVDIQAVHIIRGNVTGTQMNINGIAEAFTADT